MHARSIYGRKTYCLLSYARSTYTCIIHLYARSKYQHLSMYALRTGTCHFQAVRRDTTQYTYTDNYIISTNVQTRLIWTFYVKTLLYACSVQTPRLCTMHAARIHACSMYMHANRYHKHAVRIRVLTHTHARTHARTTYVHLDMHAICVHPLSYSLSRYLNLCHQKQTSA